MNPDKGRARIVQLAPGSSGPGFFLIPGTGGKIDGFVTLAKYLQVPVPVFTIEARGLDQTSLPDDNVEDMARHYLGLMRGVQAVGPYFLLGHSFGGLVALEIAQLLVAEQDKVACLIMLDTPTPEKIWPPVFYLTSRVAKLRRLLARLSGASLGENLAAFRRSASLRNTDLNEMPTDVMIGTNVARVLLAHGIAREAYRPKFYPGKVIFFRPLEAPSRYETLWPKRVGEMEVLPAAGAHLSMVELPHAPLLAAQLSACIKALLF